MLSYAGILKAATVVGYDWQLAGAMWSALRDDDLVRVRVYYQICVVRHDDDLAPLFGITETVHQLLKD